MKNKINKNYCEYFNFTIDCPENRIIKKALLFARNYFITHKIITNIDYMSIIYQCLSAFTLVSDDVDVDTIKTIKITPFYKEYKLGIRLAKMILKYFGYSINNTKKEKFPFPPFYINMPKLFELYVYSKLLEKYTSKDIVYQPQGNYGQPDFICKKENLKLIIDAKYKLIYYDINEKESEYDYYDIEDIRQLSGYARDKKILKILNILKDDLEDKDIKVIDCIIIYPNENGSDKIDDLLKTSINGFLRFYKFGLKLPIKNNN